MHDWAGGPFMLVFVLLERSGSNHRAKNPSRKKTPPSPSPGFVKLDFLLGTKRGSRDSRKQNRPSQSPKEQPKAYLSPRQSILYF